MQHSQNKHWRERVKPESSFFSRMLPYATGAAIGAALTVALVWGTYNAGRTRDYSSAPDSQQQVVQQENYRPKKTADKPGNFDAIKQNFFDAIKQNFFVPSKFSYPTFSERKIVSGAAKLAEKEREYEEKQKPAVKSTYKSATALPKQSEASGPCGSDHPNIKQSTEKPPYFPETADICSFKGDFDKDGEDELAGVAVITNDSPYKEKGFKKGELYFFTRELIINPQNKFRDLGAQERLSTNSSDVNARVTNLGIHELPQIVLTYKEEGKKYLRVFTFNGHQGMGYSSRALATGDRFHFADLDGNGVKELIVINGGQVAGIGAVKRPVAVLSWVPSTFHQDGSVFQRYYLDRPFGPVAETQSKLAEAATSGNRSEILRIKDSTNPYVFVAASMGLFDFSAVTDKLFADLYSMEPSAFLEQLLANPRGVNSLVLGAAFAERFVYHVQTRNDNKIDYNPAVGYTAMIDGQIHSGYRTKDDARRAIVDAEKRKHEEANRPSAYHTFRSTTTDPRSGVTTETRSTSVGGPPKTPTQWETERRVQQDPVARGLNEAYQRAGAAKGDAERRAGEVARDAGRALREATGNIGRAIEDVKRRR